MPKFSIVIPAYNCSRLITEAVDSVLNQTFQDYEIVVVDDGSIDDTRNIVEKYFQSEKFIYIYQDNLGPGAARNNGIRNSAGEYIVLLDSDDVLYETCVESLSEFLGRNNGVDFLFSNYDIFDENGVINPSGIDTWKIFRTIPHYEGLEGEWIFSESISRYIIQYGGFMHTSGTCLRRSLFEEVGYFAEGYCYGEDDELYARATYNSVSGYIDRVLSRKRNHPASLIHNPGTKLRNARDYLALTERQLYYYRNDHRIYKIIKDKIKELEYDYCWRCNENGLLSDARKEICRYLGKDFSWSLLRLLVKNILMEMHVTRHGS